MTEADTDSPKDAEIARELDRNSGGSVFARMWRRSCCEQGADARCPSLVINGKGELLLMVSFLPISAPSPVMAVARSSDRGKVWSEPHIVYSSGRETPLAQGTLTRLKSGRLLAPFVQGAAVRMLGSEDDGTSWCVSEEIDCSPLHRPTPYSQLVQLEGELLMPVYGRLPVKELSKNKIHI